MASTALNVFLLIVSLALGIGVAYFSSSLVPWIDDMMRIGIAIVLTLFAFISLYFMTKNRG